SSQGGGIGRTLREPESGPLAETEELEQDNRWPGPSEYGRARCAPVGTRSRFGTRVDQVGLGSLGRPRTRSPTMLRWIWLVPPQIVSEREKKNADIIGDTG